MPERSSKKKRPRDVNRLAKLIVDEATSDPEQPQDDQPADDGKNPAAVALGRLGGKKGGAARAAKLTPEQRSQIAKNAARARWSKAQASERE